MRLYVTQSVRYSSHSVIHSSIRTHWWCCACIHIRIMSRNWDTTVHLCNRQGWTVLSSFILLLYLFCSSSLFFPFSSMLRIYLIIFTKYLKITDILFKYKMQFARKKIAEFAIVGQYASWNKLPVVHIWVVMLGRLADGFPIRYSLYWTCSLRTTISCAYEIVSDSSMHITRFVRTHL